MRKVSIVFLFRNNSSLMKKFILISTFGLLLFFANGNTVSAACGFNGEFTITDENPSIDETITFIARVISRQNCPGEWEYEFDADTESDDGDSYDSSTDRIKQEWNTSYDSAGTKKAELVIWNKDEDEEVSKTFRLTIDVEDRAVLEVGARVNGEKENGAFIEQVSGVTNTTDGVTPYEIREKSDINTTLRASKQFKDTIFSHWTGCDEVAGSEERDCTIDVEVGEKKMVTAQYSSPADSATTLPTDSQDEIKQQLIQLLLQQIAELQKQIAAILAQQLQ